MESYKGLGLGKDYFRQIERNNWLIQEFEHQKLWNEWQIEGDNLERGLWARIKLGISENKTTDDEKWELRVEFWE